MLLTIDVGNTQTVVGVFDGDRLIDHWRIGTDARRTADELALTLQGFLSLRGTDMDTEITGVSIASVVPALTHTLREMTGRYFRQPAVIVEPGVRTGVPILTDNPKEVGADRIVNALAAYHLYGGPAIVVDFGTSTNFDVISERGEFIGGALAPGVEISIDALAARGAQLRKVEIARPRSVIGKNTVECLQSGILYGFAGQIDGILERMIAELGQPAKVIATGGLAPLIISECAFVDVHEPWLTLVGLRLVYEKNTTD
ncbi:MAG TPA: type III pantothenate kinase [Mycobacteriales bacterium]|nr:type III pantothenate kinase [Mycobacteriales bacterium]